MPGRVGRVKGNRRQAAPQLLPPRHTLRTTGAGVVVQVERRCRRKTGGRETQVSLPPAAAAAHRRAARWSRVGNGRSSSSALPLLDTRRARLPEVNQTPGGSKMGPGRAYPTVAVRDVPGQGAMGRTLHRSAADDCLTPPTRPAHAGCSVAVLGDLAADSTDQAECGTDHGSSYQLAYRLAVVADVGRREQVQAEPDDPNKHRPSSHPLLGRLV